MENLAQAWRFRVADKRTAGSNRQALGGRAVETWGQTGRSPRPQEMTSHQSGRWHPLSTTTVVRLCNSDVDGFVAVKALKTHKFQ